MRDRFGPSRGEVKARLVFGLAGLVFLIGAYATGALSGTGSLKIGATGAAFFGGTTLWCLWKLTRS